MYRMKCPVCEGNCYRDIPGEDYPDVIDCPHCRGTGEIQEGDWWMCRIRFLDTGECEEYIYKNTGGNKWRDFAGFWYTDNDCEVVPLYRMERVK